MAKNFIHSNSLSSTSNESIDVRLLLSPTESNLDLNLNPNFHRVKEEHTAYVSPHRVQVHSVIDYMPPPPGFPPKEVTTVTKVVKTTPFLTSTSTMERMLGSSSRSATNHDFFPTIQPQVPDVINQPTMNYQEALDFLNQASLHNKVKKEPNFHESNPSCNNQGLSNLDQTPVVLGNIDNLSNVHSNVKKEPIFHESPSYNNQVLSDFDQPGVVLGNLDDLNNSNATAEQVENQPGFDRSSKEDSDDENGADDDDPIGYDGRTHSLPDQPEGVYACPKCPVTCKSSQSFAAHIRSHYKFESEKARKRRMAARYRRRDFCHQWSRYGITSIPESSMGISKENTARRNNGIAIKVEKVHMGFDLKNPRIGATMDAPPRRGVIKEEPM